jgi:hypothetical protein
VIAADDSLYAARPAARLTAARDLSDRALRALRKQLDGWPPDSPGSLNAWLVLCTTKPPAWRDPLISWRELPLTAGEPHEGFFYPDPLGFWAEVRRWSIQLFRTWEPAWSTAEALALTTLVHVGDDANRVDLAVETCRPRLLIFLDEPAARTAGLRVTGQSAMAVPDPHREGKLYEGWWGVAGDGMVVGKSPQHPTMHNLYRREDLTEWLSRAPRPS